MTVPVLAGFLGGPEMWVILCLLLLFFGASKLPGVARAFGQSVNQFKAGMKDEPEPSKPAGDAGSQKN